MVLNIPRVELFYANMRNLMLFCFPGNFSQKYKTYKTV